jgi:hypothetical protein
MTTTYTNLLTCSDVAFAQLYFTAINNFTRQADRTLGSWQALFEARHRAGVKRIQFALAEMNAQVWRLMFCGHRSPS